MSNITLPECPVGWIKSARHSSWHFLAEQRMCMLLDDAVPNAYRKPLWFCGLHWHKHQPRSRVTNANNEIKRSNLSPAIAIAYYTTLATSHTHTYCIFKYTVHVRVHAHRHARISPISQILVATPSNPLQPEVNALATYSTVFDKRLLISDLLWFPTTWEAVEWNPSPSCLLQGIGYMQKLHTVYS